VSDGIAHQFAAQMDGQCVLSNVGVGTMGVNHQELVNHPSMTAVYDSILNGSFALPTGPCTPDLAGWFTSF